MAEPSTDKSRSKPKSRVTILSQVQLPAGIVLVLALVIAVVGYVSLQTFQRATTITLYEANQVRELTNRLQANFLLARQGEAEFMNTWRTYGYSANTQELVAENEKYLANARTELANLERLVAEAEDTELRSVLQEIHNLRPLLVEYESTFQKTVQLIGDRSSAEGVDAAIKAEMETLMSGFGELAETHYLQLIIKIKQNEEEYFTTRRYEYYDNVRIQVDRLIGMVRVSTSRDLENLPFTKMEAIQKIENYLSLFDQIVQLEQEIDVNTTIFKDSTVEINEHIANIDSISQAGVQRADKVISDTGRHASIALTFASLLALALGLGLSIFISISLVLPIRRLTRAAEEMGKGKFTEPVVIEKPVEMNLLAETFNSMSMQLQEMLAGLEQRVAERTRDLEKRSSELQVAAEVARDAASIRDLNVLLSQSVNLILERFSFYHAGIFLVDSRKEYAVLRAATGEAGRQMLEQHHKLQIGEVGIVGKVCQTGKPMISLDVGSDAVHFKNPLLPETRSELALPLIAGDEIIGALDVQSLHPAAFGEEEVAVLQTMADQLAVAIENARLLRESQENLKTLEAVYSAYTKKSWEDLQKTRTIPGFRYEDEEIIPLETATAGDAPHSIPLVVRGETIGYLDIWPEGEILDPEQIAMIETLCSRISQAMESARLYEETQQRAERERLISEITSKVRASTDLNVILQTSISEVSQALKIPEARILIRGTAGEGGVE